MLVPEMEPFLLRLVSISRQKGNENTFELITAIILPDVKKYYGRKTNSQKNILGR